MRQVTNKQFRKLFPGSASNQSVPNVRRLDDVFSFGRILGHVYVDGESLAEKQVKAEHATKERNGIK